MGRRNRIPPVLLSLLALLTALFALVALHGAPPSAVLTVQNGTAETFGTPLGSQPFSMDLTISVSSGPGGGQLSQVRLVIYAPPAHMAVYQTHPTLTLLGNLRRDAIEADLASYAAVTGGATPWVRHGSRFERTESLTAFTLRVHNSSGARGTVDETAIVRGDYLVYLHVGEVVPAQTLSTGQSITVERFAETFRLLRVDGSAAPAIGS